VAISLVASACGGTIRTTSPGGTPGEGAAGLTWLLTAPALKAMTAYSGSRAVLAQGRVDELAASVATSVGGVDVVAVRGFDAVTALSAWIHAGRSSGQRAILYDPEAWARTPVAEQAHIAGAIASAGSAARNGGVVLLVSPGLDLAARLDPSVLPSWRAYVALGLAADVGRAGGVLIVQAQSLERQASEYAAFVHATADQARAARPGTAVLAGISTNPSGAPVTLNELERAVEASRPYVNGYWLNIPSRGPTCPRCRATRPELGIELLVWLGHRSGDS